MRVEPIITSGSFPFETCSYDGEINFPELPPELMWNSRFICLNQLDIVAHVKYPHKLLKVILLFEYFSQRLIMLAFFELALKFSILDFPKTFIQMFF